MTTPRQYAEYRRLEHLGGVELLRASYTTHSFAPHTHEHYVVGLVERGVETYRYRGERVTALPGQLIFVNPGEVHTGEAGVPEGWSYRTLYPDAGLVRESVGWLFGGELPFFKKTVVTDAESALRLRAFHTAAWTGTRLEQTSRFTDLLVYLFSRHADIQARVPRLTPEHVGVARARAYLDANALENVSLDEVAAAAGLSPFHLSRIFKTRLGLSPYAYQMSLRLRRAKGELKAGRSAAQVAVDLGFFDQSHFTKRFKGFVGVTPTQYQRSLK